MSDVSVDIIKNRSGEAPDLPSGANLSGVSTAATLQVTNLNPTHINASGVTTATTFSGSLKSTGTPTLGLGVTINSSGINISGVATAGIVSATTLYGDGSNLTGVAMSIAPISYNPDVNDSSVTLGTGIGITFTERIIAGSGNVTLRIAGAAGTVVENFGVGSSVTINNNLISIDPTSDLNAGETYHISYPSGSFKNTAGDLDYVGTAYTFGVKPTFFRLFTRGDGEYGATAQNDEVNRSSPIQVGTDGNWSSVHAGAYAFHGAGTKTDGTLWAWGRNEHGALGQNQAPAQLAAASSPVQITGTTWTTKSDVSFGQIQAIKSDGTLWSWGYNQTGCLGQNNRTNYSSPVQIPGTTWSEVASGMISVHAIKTDGTLWGWGEQHDAGNLGINDKVNRSSPVQIPGTTWSKVNSGRAAVAAIKTDGTLWQWGYNTHGNLGQNNLTRYSSPVQVPGTTWKSVTVSLRGTGAVKTDGTLWSWGSNNYGQLGLNSQTDYSSPVQVPGTTWNAYHRKSASGYYGQLAVASKTDGTMWVWGRGDKGQLGQNQSFMQLSSPTQIPGTDWGIESHQFAQGHNFGLNIKEV